MPAKPKGVARVFFQEILEGDRRKLEARSNDSKTGGGARDLRVPHTKFWPVLRHMFPGQTAVKRTRNGERVDFTIHTGTLYTTKGGVESSVEVTYEPPTDARPSE